MQKPKGTYDVYGKKSKQIKYIEKKEKIINYFFEHLKFIYI